MSEMKILANYWEEIEFHRLMAPRNLPNSTPITKDAPAKMITNTTVNAEPNGLCRRISETPGERKRRFTNQRSVKRAGLSLPRSQPRSKGSIGHDPFRSNSSAEP